MMLSQRKPKLKWTENDWKSRKKGYESEFPPSFLHSTLLSRVATVREKYMENEFFFQVREKSGSFVDGQGNLERTWKVSEKSGTSKINGYGRQFSENLFILFKRGKDVL